MPSIRFPRASTLLVLSIFLLAFLPSASTAEEAPKLLGAITQR